MRTELKIPLADINAYLASSVDKLVIECAVQAYLSPAMDPQFTVFDGLLQIIFNQQDVISE